MSSEHLQNVVRDIEGYYHDSRAPMDGSGVHVVAALDELRAGDLWAALCELKNAAHSHEYWKAVLDDVQEDLTELMENA